MKSPHDNSESGRIHFCGRQVAFQEKKAVIIRMSKLFDAALIDDPLDFIIGLLQASTEYSIIGKALDGTILL